MMVVLLLPLMATLFFEHDILPRLKIVASGEEKRLCKRAGLIIIALLILQESCINTA